MWMTKDITKGISERVWYESFHKNANQET